MTHPCLHYSINEAWFHASKAEDAALLRAHAAGGPAATPSDAVVAASAAASGKTASGGDARWSYIVDPKVGFGRSVALYNHSSTSYQIRQHIRRSLSISETTMRPNPTRRLAIC